MVKNEVLVIPDAHAEPGENNDRFEWAMKLAILRKPKLIISMGDFCDMGSLCSYDVGKLNAEGRRLNEDVIACHSAIKRFMKPLKDYNNKMSKMKKKKYTPKIVFLIGNHEHRIDRAANENPHYYGYLSLNDLGYKKNGFKVVPFLKAFVYENICFKHYFTSGVMGRPVSGENHAASLVKKGYMSCVAGHSHMRDFWETTTAAGKRVCGLVAGCYFEGDHSFTTENNRYWRGLVYLRDVNDGSFQPEFLVMDYLKRKFG